MLSYCTYSDLSQNALSSTQVNTILHRMLSVTPLTGKQINLSNQNPLAPATGQGIIDKTTLTTNGNTITTDSSITDLVGKWVFDKYSTTTSGNTSAVADYNNAACLPAKAYFTIKTAGNLEWGDINDQCTLTITNGTWTTTGNALNLNIGSSPINFIVISVSATNLTLKYLDPNDSTAYYTFTLIKG